MIRMRSATRLAAAAMAHLAVVAPACNRSVQHRDGAPGRDGNGGTGGPAGEDAAAGSGGAGGGIDVPADPAADAPADAAGCDDKMPCGPGQLCCMGCDGKRSCVSGPSCAAAVPPCKTDGSVADAMPKTCGFVACPADLYCADRPDDGCDPTMGGADCPGLCVSCVPAGTCKGGVPCGPSCCPSGEWCDDSSGPTAVCRCGAGPSCPTGAACVGKAMPMASMCGTACCAPAGMPPCTGG